MKFNPFPVLTTERLVLRQLTGDDREAVYFMRSDDKVNEFISRVRIQDAAGAEAFITDINLKIDNGDIIFWAISLRGSDELIGTICLWNFSPDYKIAELGYELNPAFQGLGYMNEAIRSVMEFAFHTLGVQTVEAFTQKNNARSIRLLKKNGFTHLPGRVDEGNPLNIVFQSGVSV
jgi:ribosomal-protein-alanine N-acetyltransferase